MTHKKLNLIAFTLISSLLLTTCGGSGSTTSNSHSNANSSGNDNLSTNNTNLKSTSVVNNQTFGALLKSASACTGSSCPSGAYFVKNASELSMINNSLKAQKQPTDQWSNNHYAILLASGGDFNMGQGQSFELGYYTQVLGLGDSPESVTVSPGVQIHNQCGPFKDSPRFEDATDDKTKQACEEIGGLNNFWRGIENFTMDGKGLPPDQHEIIYAVSQAAPIRSMDFKKSLLLCDWHTKTWNCGRTSGGFMANTTISDAHGNTAGNLKLVLGSQQQWLTRNSKIDISGQAVWNAVFVGDSVTNYTLPEKRVWYYEPDDSRWGGTFPLTTELSTPVIKEKPYLTCANCTTATDGNWKVVVPTLRKQSRMHPVISIDYNVSNSIPISNFYVISPQSGTTTNGVTEISNAKIQEINSALANKHLIIMPGVYNLEGTIRISRPGTIVLGLGLPSLVCANGTSCMHVIAQRGVELAGITFEAGYKLTPNLLQIGDGPRNEVYVRQNNSANPIALYDVFFRIAETQLATRDPNKERQTTAALVIYTNNVIGDNLWIWRADHDKASSSGEDSDPEKNLVKWNQDRAKYGLIVYGNDVTIYGLAVEHFQDYQTYWYGNGGRVYFYQSEMPYDVPNLEQWACHKPGSNQVDIHGCASYVVDNSVTTHNAYGVGVYTYFVKGPIMAPSAIKAPYKPGVIFKHIIGKWLMGYHENYIGSGMYGLVTDSDEVDEDGFPLDIWGGFVNHQNQASILETFGGQ